MVRTRTAIWAGFLCIAIVSGFLIYNYGYRRFYKMAYPAYYIDLIYDNTNKYDNLPIELVLAVIRTESGFRPLAESHVGARGLMQITEETFEWAYWRMGKTDKISYEQLFDPATNIEFGTYILSRHINEFGSIPLALCAYHAGRGSLHRWLANPELSSDGKTLMSIPFQDTDSYVKKVMYTMDMYARLYDFE